MTPLHIILLSAQGSDLIRKCWGEVPCFDGPCDVIHVSQISAGSAEQEILLTALFLTNESDTGNDCKPSRMHIRFSGVVAWDYDYGCAIRNGIESAGVFKEPPAECMAIDADVFRIVCRGVAIISCQREPFIGEEGQKVGT